MFTDPINTVLVWFGLLNRKFHEYDSKIGKVDLGQQQKKQMIPSFNWSPNSEQFDEAHGRPLDFII